ncbi:hypothetical protein BDR06DRAFT_954849 [Suillus hirtellus]|nr:hypothetical protein BDR06DRAFT_954849 [Suillus hirtellus]
MFPSFRHDAITSYLIRATTPTPGPRQSQLQHTITRRRGSMELATWWPQLIGGARTKSLAARYRRSDWTDMRMQMNLLWHVQLGSGNCCQMTSCTGRRHKNTAIAPVSCNNARKTPTFVTAEINIKTPAATYGCTIRLTLSPKRELRSLL